MDRETFAKLLKRQWGLGHREFWALYEERRNFFDNLLVYKYVHGTEKMWDGKSSLDGKNVPSMQSKAWEIRFSLCGTSLC